jgi:hypothetical protein
MSETNIHVDCGHCITPTDRCSDESDRNCANRPTKKVCLGHPMLVRTGPGEDDYDADMDYCNGECRV